MKYEKWILDQKLAILASSEEMGALKLLLLYRIYFLCFLNIPCLKIEFCF